MLPVRIGRKEFCFVVLVGWVFLPFVAFLFNFKIWNLSQWWKLVYFFFLMDFKSTPNSSHLRWCNCLFCLGPLGRTKKRAWTQTCASAPLFCRVQHSVISLSWHCTKSELRNGTSCSLYLCFCICGHINTSRFYPHGIQRYNATQGELPYEIF